MAIVFNTNHDVSLKSVTRDDRVRKKGKMKKIPRQCQIESNIIIKKIPMSEILATNETKRSLTTFLMRASRDHLAKSNVKFLIAGNGVTYSSFQDVTVNNDEEADTLMINCLCSIQPIESSVVVYYADTDVFVLLLRHHGNILCKNFYMNLLSGFADITRIYQSLGEKLGKALLSLHSLTGCDTSGKFAGISEEFWSRRFMDEKHNEQFIQFLRTLLVLLAGHIDFLVQQKIFQKTKYLILVPHVITPFCGQVLKGKSFHLVKEQ